MFGPDFIQHAIVYGPVILLSLTVHEYCHAWTAFRFGDDTAARQGRLTLNPLAHLDLFGTIVMVMSQFRFGWAKPVPFNPMRLRNPRAASIWVSAAGPLANFGMALIWAIFFRMTFDMSDGLTRYAIAGVEINVVLGIFNLVPLFPLDGSHIVNISSVLAHTGSTQGVHYTASKAGLMGMTKALARELAPKGIVVNCIAPGAIDTDLIASDTEEQREGRNKLIPVGRIGAPEEIASMVGLLFSGRCGFITGATIDINGGYWMG